MCSAANHTRLLTVAPVVHARNDGCCNRSLATHHLGSQRLIARHRGCPSTPSTAPTKCPMQQSSTMLSQSAKESENWPKRYFADHLILRQ